MHATAVTTQGVSGEFRVPKADVTLRSVMSFSSRAEQVEVQTTSEHEFNSAESLALKKSDVGHHICESDQ